MQVKQLSRESIRLYQRRAGSSPKAHSSQSEPHEPVDRGFGRQSAGCQEGVDTLARELVGWDMNP